MKKLLKLAACLGLTISMVACSGSKVQDEALDQLETSIAKFSEISSFDYTVGVTSESDDVNLLVSGGFMSEDGIQFSCVIDLESNGTKMDKFMEVYLQDNMTYISMFGVKQKSEADLSSMAGFSFDGDTFKLPKEEIKKALSEAKKDGNTLHLVFSKDFIKEAMESNSTANTTGVSEISDLSIDVELENDFISKMTMNVTGKQKDKEITAVLTITISNVNNVTEIAFPSDLDSYTESASTDL